MRLYLFVLVVFSFFSFSEVNKQSIYEEDVEQLLQKVIYRDYDFVYSPVDDIDRVAVTSRGNTIYVTSHPTNYSFSLYYFLNKLGYRFYGGENWTYIPEINSTDISFDEKMKFRTLKFAPTSGTRQGNYKIYFARKLTRNLSQVSLGHDGQKFVKNHKHNLSANDYALIDGKRTNKPVLCFSNGVEYKYLDWIDEKIKKAQKKKTPGKTLLSVDPADFIDLCECGKCQKSFSNGSQYYYLANKAAEHLDKRGLSHKYVIGICAYSTHAAPPDFDLHPNVRVALAASAYQNVAYAPEFVRLWQEKTSNTYLRDYINLSQWKLEKPDWGSVFYFHNLVNKVKGMGLNFETTGGSLPAGFIHYIISQNSIRTVDLNQEIIDFNERMFAESKLTYEELTRRFDLANQSYHHHYQLKEYLDAAKTKNFEEQRRIDDLKFYANYILQLNIALAADKEKKYEAYTVPMNILVNDKTTRLHSYDTWKRLNKITKIKRSDKRFFKRLNSSMKLNIPRDVIENYQSKFKLIDESESLKVLMPNYKSPTITQRRFHGTSKGYIYSNGTPIKYSFELKGGILSNAKIVVMDDKENVFSNVHTKGQSGEVSFLLPKGFYKLNILVGGSGTLELGFNSPFAVESSTRHISKNIEEWWIKARNNVIINFKSKTRIIFVNNQRLNIEKEGNRAFFSPDGFYKIETKRPSFTVMNSHNLHSPQKELLIYK